VWLLVATSGCNALFGIDTVESQVVACGPYGAPTPVSFGAITGAYDLSLDATGAHGLVLIKTNPPTANPQLLPILQMPDLSYAEDKTREPGLSALRTAGLASGHITGSVNHQVLTGMLDPTVQADMFAATLAGSVYVVQHFADKTPMGWTGAESMIVDGAPDQSVYPGNELELTTQVATQFTRYLSVVRVDADLNRTVDVDVRLPDASAWTIEVIDRVPVTNTISPVHSVQQAVLAFGALPGATQISHPLVLVYNATSTIDKTDTSPQLYVSAKTANGYPVGKPIDVDFEPGSYLEPWVNVDCTTLWFRRDDVIYRADAL
jgi:hypothetical protein